MIGKYQVEIMNFVIATLTEETSILEMDILFYRSALRDHTVPASTL